MIDFLVLSQLTEALLMKASGKAWTWIDRSLAEWFGGDIGVFV